MTSGIDHHVQNEEDDGSATSALKVNPPRKMISNHAIQESKEALKEEKRRATASNNNNNDDGTNTSKERFVVESNTNQQESSSSSSSGGMFDLILSTDYFHSPAEMVEKFDASSGVEYPPLSSWLLPNESWSTITKHANNNDDNNNDGETELKILYLVRHGEGEHNAAETKYGTKYWNDVISKTMKYFDPSLTTVGVTQCKGERDNVDEQMNTFGMPLDTIVVSPLTRTIETAMIVFQDCIQTSSSSSSLSDDNGDQKKKKKVIPMISDEYCRETLGVHTCDERHNVSYLQSTYPTIDFTMIETNQDTWWSPTHRETSEEVEARARTFLHRVFDRDYASEEEEEAGSVGKFVAVVTHSGFIQACVRALGGGVYMPANGEVVPLAILRKKNEDAVASFGLYGRSGGGEDGIQSNDDSIAIVSYVILFCILFTSVAVMIRYGRYVVSVWNEQKDNHQCRRLNRKRRYMSVLDDREGMELERGVKEHHVTNSF